VWSDREVTECTNEEFSPKQQIFSGFNIVVFGIKEKIDKKLVN
jgi:hypothetical protein